MLALEFFQAGARNEALDPRFESGVFAGSVRDQPAAGLVHHHGVSKINAIEGTYSLRLAVSANATAGSYRIARYGYLVPVTANSPWSFAADCGHITSPDYTGALLITWVDAAGAEIADTDLTPAPAGIGSPVRLEIHGSIAPQNAVAAKFGMVMLAATSGAVDAAAQVIFDRVIVSPAARCPEFFDGDSPLCEWDGPRFYSASERIGEAESMLDMQELAPPFFFSEMQA